MANNMPTPPKVPTAQQPQRPPPGAKPAGPAVNHPAVNDYVQQWNAMAHELDRLRTENGQLRYDLDCARNMISELQHISDHERAKKEAYQRFAIRFDTLAGEIAGLAITLRDEAQKAAEPEPAAQQIEDTTAQQQPPHDSVEDGIAKFAKKFAPQPLKTDGATYGKTTG